MKAFCLYMVIPVFMLMCGCFKPPISAELVKEQTLWKERQQNALNSKKLSEFSTKILRMRFLEQKYLRSPSSVISVLHDEAVANNDRDIIFALAEICYHSGLNVEHLADLGQKRFTRVLKYSYYYLFDPDLTPKPNPFDPRFRLACDLYNLSLVKCLRLFHKTKIELGEDLKFESLPWQVSFHGFLRPKEDFHHFIFAHNYRARGMKNRHMRHGLGTPLIVINERKPSKRGAEKYYIGNKPGFPATALAHISGFLQDFDKSKIEIHVYDPLHMENIALAETITPLESDLTTHVAHHLGRSEVHKLGLFGLFRVEKTQHLTGLYMSTPYEKGKIPVVMVHGLFSSPITWVQMFNDLRSDPQLHRHYQFWFFLYPTGNPILYSGHSLREALKDVQKTLNPNGEDPAMNEMVLVGHSMGGLLTKLMLQNSGTRVVDEKMLHNSAVDIKDMTLLRKVLFFEPLPFIRRAVFIATPHRGSELSTSIFGRIGAGLIALPNYLVKLHNRVTSKLPFLQLNHPHNRIPTSIEGLSPDSPFMRSQSSLPIKKGIPYHSIIGNIAKEGKESTDGVVPYISSHLEGAASELIVPEGHSCTDHPLTIRELRRILLQNLKERN